MCVCVYIYAYFCKNKNKKDKPTSYLQGLVGSEGQERGTRDKGRDSFLSEYNFCVVLTFGIILMFYIFKK